MFIRPRCPVMTLDQWIALANLGASVFIPVLTGTVVALHHANKRRWDAIEAKGNAIEQRLIYIERRLMRWPASYDR